ncbi:hypothetical protein GUJ93_ZPchr0009g1617 [Zizania palustris]|uniref:Uncharacterized protein n=1 Tax=Zizania palustris TaxID=103762 RepID=A0A8J5VKR9_ZIZPA|nr:hypothetical protein GUJ93_ZPchr0009g1617 [Zizania palustris]
MFIFLRIKPSSSSTTLLPPLSTQPTSAVSRPHYVSSPASTFRLSASRRPGILRPHLAAPASPGRIPSPSSSYRRPGRLLPPRRLPAASCRPGVSRPHPAALSLISPPRRQPRSRIPAETFSSSHAACSHNPAAAYMAPSGFFFDLSLLPDNSSSISTGTSSRLLAAALDLGYSAVALDRPHRGLLADSHSASCIASPLPLPTSASLHRRRHPFQQYTRLTLSLDSAAACASALAPSAVRLLRTYDIVAARPLTQAAFDHLCQVAFDHLDIVSIDFSYKLPFRLKLPMLKLALQRGLYFEIAYSPLITDATSGRQLMAQAKLLVDWTKGKNLIISSAAHVASEIRGPYDVVNLCAYLLGLSTQRAKAAISVNCRTLISKAMRKKHFYKETIRIDSLLPNEQLNSANFKLGDWIGCDLIPCKADLLSLGMDLEPSSDKGELSGYKSLNITIEPSSNKDELLHSPMNGLTNVSHHVHQVMRDEVAPIDRTTISMECTLYDPETTSSAFLYDEGFNDTIWKIDESTKQNSNGTKSSLNENVAKLHRQPLNYSCATGEVEISLVKSEKQTKKWSHHPAYLPFLGFLKSVHFKKKTSKVLFKRRS